MAVCFNLGPVSTQNSCHLLQCSIYGVGDRLRTSQKRGLLDVVCHNTGTKISARAQIFGKQAVILNNITYF